MTSWFKRNKRPQDNSDSVQKIIIPQGVIQDGENTIIEIPSRFQNSPIVIAKRKVKSRGNDVDPLPRGFTEDMMENMMNVNRLSSVHKEFPSQYIANPETDASDSDSVNWDETERNEKDEFERNLREYQLARRKLLQSSKRLQQFSPQ